MEPAIQRHHRRSQRANQVKALRTPRLPIENQFLWTLPNTWATATYHAHQVVPRDRTRPYHVCSPIIFTIWGGFLYWLLLILSRAAVSGVFFMTACQPGGSFSPYGDDYNWWSKDGFFEITYGFGSLSFTEAKIIDVAWDLVSRPTVFLVLWLPTSD